MISAWRFAVRPCTVLLAVLAVMFSFSLAGTAVAAPGNGNGAGHADVAVAGTTGSGQSAKSDPKSTNKGGATASAHQRSGNSGTSGTPPQKQPLSNADENTGGANGKCPAADGSTGPYCGTTRDKPSANGNGGGQSTGKPCAGCVGKADNKNPKGQYPGPQDNNNGYECDGNHGIARGNPAHTGCTSGPTTTSDKCVPKANEYVDADGNCVKKSSDCLPTAANNYCAKSDVCVPGSGEMVNDQGECVPVCPTDSSIPMDDEDCNPLVAPEEGPGANRPPTVAGVEAFAGPQPPAAVEQFAGPSAAVGPTGILPSTGAGTLMNALALTGGSLLLLGAATLLLRRKGSQA